MAIGNDFLDFYLQLLNVKNQQTTVLKDIQTQLQNQNLSQTSSQGQTQNDIDTISNVGNPTVNINISSSASSDEVTQTPSAFKALTSADQPITANTFVKILYQNEQFDIANEYDPTTSVFTAATDGIYIFMASLNFLADDPTIDYAVAIDLIVNNVSLNLDDEFWGRNVTRANAVVQITDILQLKAGDQVEARIQSTANGRIISESPGAVRFTAVKQNVPS